MYHADGRRLLDYDLAIPKFSGCASGLATKRYYFTKFYWYNGEEENRISRTDLVTAYCQLLEAHDVLFNVERNLDDVVKQMAKLHPSPRSRYAARLDGTLHDSDHGIVTCPSSRRGCSQ